MWRKSIHSLHHSKWEFLQNAQLQKQVFSQRKIQDVTYSKWTQTKRCLQESNVSKLWKYPSYFYLSSKLKMFNVSFSLTREKNILIYSIQKNRFIPSTFLNNYGISLHKNIHTSTYNDSRQKNPEGKFCESDPFVLNETKLDKYCHSEPQTEFGEVSRLNIGLKGRVTEEDLIPFFPQTRATLNNFQLMLGKKIFDISHKNIQLKKKKKNTIKDAVWISKVKLMISDPIEFEGSGSTKASATQSACLKTLHWLFINKYINKHGIPIHSREEIEAMKKDLNPPINLKLPLQDKENLVKLINTYDAKIDNLLEIQNEKELLVDKSKATCTEEDDFSMDDENEIDFKFSKKENDAFHTKPEDKDEELINYRSSILLKRYENRPEEKELPITSYKHDILRVMESHNAIVISGAPGCGKSTRVPSYILDHLTESREGGNCNIMISQPRRVAAISLAHRVSSERRERMGDVCGYQVRLSSNLPRAPGGVLLFCTAGTLLRRLSTSPDLPGCSHLIIDEAHERSIDTDAVLALTKQAMVLNPRLKVIIMSATLDTQLFSKYFGDCPILNIPGFIHPVESHYLEDLPKEISFRMNKAWNSSNVNDFKPIIDPNEVAHVIKWLNKVKPEGAILTFLPGWREIVRVKDILEKSNNSKEYIVLPIHSRLSNEDQQRIFSHVPPGLRKIILATNIAETSITINDVSYVVDTGAFKENRIVDDKGLSSLNNSWITKANVKQRKGRAGRVKSGECYHLYTRQKMDTFDDNPLPEIHRISLEKTVLECKIYNENETALNFLQRFPQPPNSQSIQVAVNNLIDLGALDDKENLTELGKRIVAFTTHPKLSKALIYSTIFRVTSPVLIAVTILSNNYDFFTCSVDAKRELREVKKQYHPTSDHQAMYWIQKHYQSLKNDENYRIANSFCQQNFIRKEKLDSLADTREIYVGHLQQCKMLNIRNYMKGLSFGKNDEYSHIDELAKAVLLSGLNSFLSARAWVKTYGKLEKTYDLYTENNQKAFLSAESTNNKIETVMNDAILLYCGGVHFEERRGVLVRESSLLSPLSVFLFCSNVNPVSVDGNYLTFEINNSKLKMRCSRETADILMHFRKIMWRIVEYYVQNEGFDFSNEVYDDDDDDGDDDDDEDVPKNDIAFKKNHKEIDKFWRDLLENLSRILSEAEIKSITPIKSDKDDEYLGI